MTVRRYLTALTSAPTYRYLQVAMLLVLGTAFVTSFESGTEGAKRLGYPEGFESALPLVCDVIAGVATLIHGRVRGDRQMRRLASLFVLVPMLLSWGANSVDHLGSAPADPRWLLAAQVGWVAGVILAAGICPVSVAALLHLSAKFVEYEQRQAEKAERRAASTPKPRSRRDADTSPGATAPDPAESTEQVPVDEQLEQTPRATPLEPKPWSARARQLIDAGTPKATAYRQARKEWEQQHDRSA